MSCCIILCFTLTLFSILTINAYSDAKIATTTNLNSAVDSVMHAIQLDKTYNSENYEEIVGDLLQNIILQTTENGNLNVKILNVNTTEGLLDVEVTKQFIWHGIKKDIIVRRTVVLDEFENPPATPVIVHFKYMEEENEVIWRVEDTFAGAILKRPKQPKKAGYVFSGWSLEKDGDIISDEAWQDYIVPKLDGGTDIMTFYAIFTPKS